MYITKTCSISGQQAMDRDGVSWRRISSSTGEILSGYYLDIIPTDKHVLASKSFVLHLNVQINFHDFTSASFYVSPD